MTDKDNQPATKNTVTADLSAMPPGKLPALSVPCPACGSAAGQLCTSHSGTRLRRSDVHQARTAAYTAANR
ncbi:zinc finger domain-containing protein [Streptomyces harbinensis]|uniref:zinc finger domain-containing protein n=1 Tax=Streptomyces harbinensis TaxID=1176198 RepID=UPI0034DEF433